MVGKPLTSSARRIAWNRFQRSWLACSLLAAGALAWAGQAQTTFIASTTVAPICSFTVINLNFGAIAAAPTVNVDATSTVTATCTSGTPYSMVLNAGNGRGANVETRKMTSGAYTLNYSLYTNAGRTIVWGDGTRGSPVSNTGSGAAQAITVFGRVFGGQTVPTATYNDTILVTLTF